MNTAIKATVATLVFATSASVAVMYARSERAVDATDTVASHAGDAKAHIAHMAAAGDVHANHAMDEMRWAPAQAAPVNVSLPADDAGAKERLAASPRKGEFVTIDVAGSPIRAWVVKPQGTAKAPVVVVIQEIFGLSDWIRGVADQLAAEGYIAVAPDLLSGKGPNGGDSSSIAGADMMRATLALPGAEVMARLKAARAYGLKLPQSNGKSATVGFCFGGTQSFTLAVEEPGLNAAVVFYGTAPTAGPGGGMPSASGPFVPSDALANIKAPVLGLYADPARDGMIGNGLPATDAKMKALNKVYEPHIFSGSDHGFLRAQGAANGANLRASQQAWPLAVAWIKQYAS